MTVVCPKCGATNRIPDPPVPSVRYLCAKCKTRLTHPPKAPSAKGERSVILQPAAAEEKYTAKVVGILLLYLLVITVAEAFLHFAESALGVVCHVILLVALIAQPLRVTERHSRLFLLSLAIVPLSRIISLVAWGILSAFNVEGSLAFTAFVNPLLLVAAVATMLVLGLRARGVGLALGKPLPQLLVGLTGIIFGLALYYVAKPEPLVPELDWGKIIMAASAILIGAVQEELIFRGILQRTSMAVFGLRGLVYVSLVFALMHFGDISGMNLSVISIPLIFGIALFYSWVVKRTGSLLGVTLSHFIINIIFFLVAPLAL